MPLLAPYQETPPAGRSGKRKLAVIGATVAAVFGVAAALTAAHPGLYGQSRAGCVTVTIPSSTGGALLHDCGDSARALCRRAGQRSDRMSLLIRPACRQAGLG